MTLGNLARQTSAGCIVGLSAVIYSISYGVLLFSGPLSAHVGIGIAAALVTAIIGALFGLLSEERSFISGPDSNTISVMVATIATLGSLGLSESLTLKLALETIFLTSIVCALAFYALARYKLTELVRYIPFSVMAGFLASTGWLMCSGALNIIAEMPLSVVGLNRLMSDPYRPELFAGLAVVVGLYAMASRLSGALLIPLTMMLSTALVNAFLASGICDAAMCSRSIWLFAGLQDMPWSPAWTLAPDVGDVSALISALPSMLVVIAPAL